MALAMKKAVKPEEGWTDAYYVPGLLLALLISGLRATDVMLSVRTTRSLGWCLILTNRGSKALAPKPSWVWNSGDAAEVGHWGLQTGHPNSLTDIPELGDGGSGRRRPTSAVVLGNSGVVAKQGPAKGDRGGLPPCVQSWESEPPEHPTRWFCWCLKLGDSDGPQKQWRTPQTSVFVYLLLILSPVKNVYMGNMLWNIRPNTVA